MTIAKRMICLIALLAVSLVGIGGMAIYQLNELGNDLEEAHNVTAPALLSSVEIERDFLFLRTLVLTNIAADSPQQTAQLEREVASVRSGIDRRLEEYQATYLFDETDQKLFDEVKKQLRDYYPVAEEIMAAARANDDEEALRLVNTKCAQGSARVKAAIDAHLAYNKQLAAQTRDLALKQSIQAEWIMGVTIIISLALALMIGWLTYKAVIGSLNNMNKVVSEIASTLDFTRRADVRGNDEAAQTTRAFNGLLDTMQNSFSRLVQHINQVAGAASNLADSANQVANSSAKQSDATASVAAAVEQMTASINHVADRTNEANELATRSGDVAHTGAGVINDSLQDIRHIGSVVHDASGIVEQLDNESGKVTSVVAVIKEVAEQTNLLALNAASEAARAGEQGRGFAVVADEVRKLAERTALSTQEISATLEHMQTGARNAVKSMGTAVEQVTNGVAHTEEAERSIRQIADSSEQTVEMVKEITWAIREQSEASTNIAQQVERIAQMTEENNNASADTAETAQELSALASKMQEEISRYRV